MAKRNIVVIAGSAGAVQEIRTLIGALPSRFGGSVFIVLHTASEGGELLAGILDRTGPLRASMARHGESIHIGHVYVAPGDHHLILTPARVKLGRGPRENGFRPAADALFRTAANAYGRRVVGVVLSGGLDDGTLGLQAIKSRGGVAIVQDPKQALFTGMPTSAIREVEVDYILPIEAIAGMLKKLADEEIPSGGSRMERHKNGQGDPAVVADLAIDKKTINGPPSPFVCPECGGALWQMESGKILHFRCHVGHAYTSETLLADQNRALEEALWVALRTLEENAALRLRLARGARSRHLPNVGKGYEESAARIEQRAGVIREVLLQEKLPAKVKGYPSSKPAKLLSRAAERMPNRKRERR